MLNLAAFEEILQETVDELYLREQQAKKKIKEFSTADKVLLMESSLTKLDEATTVAFAQLKKKYLAKVEAIIAKEINGEAILNLQLLQNYAQEVALPAIDLTQLM